MDLIIKTDGKVEFSKCSKYDLKQMQKIVGGHIELVDLSHDDFMVINEEGAINGMPINKTASIIYGSPIFGDVLICNKNHID